MANTKTNRQAYDEACRKILVNKWILAWLLQACAVEFKNLAINDIAQKYIDGTPEICQVKVNDTLEVETLANEDKSVNEGTIVYDIKFKAMAPTIIGEVQLIVNVEAQNKFSEGYPLIKRGIYYGCRLISAQHGPIFVKSNYEKIQKVYSIWICPRPNPQYRNTITEYKFMENNIHGTVHEEEQNYDLISVVIIGLGKKRKKDIKTLPVIDLLRTIFVDKISQYERTSILKNNYNVQLTVEDEKELETMCNLSEGLIEEGISIGEKTGAEKLLIELVKDKIISIAEAAKRAGMTEAQFSSML